MSDLLCQLASMCQLITEALPHIVVNIIRSEQLLKGLCGISQVLFQYVADASALTHLLTEVGELSSLDLDQTVVFPGIQSRIE